LIFGMKFIDLLLDYRFQILDFRLLTKT
jgi:hypothetical protein